MALGKASERQARAACTVHCIAAATNCLGPVYCLSVAFPPATERQRGGADWLEPMTNEHVHVDISTQLLSR